MAQVETRGSTPRTQVAMNLAFDAIHDVMSRPFDADAAQRLAALRPDEAASEVVYLSTPITTGPRLLTWLKNEAASHGQASSRTLGGVVREEVIAENLARLGPVRQAALARYPRCYLIDPTTLTVPGWSQWQYHRFWVEVLRTLVDRVIFADGWHLSTGCVVEYATALELGLPMEDAAGNRLTPESASILMREGAQTLSAAGRDRSYNDAAAGRAEQSAREPLKDAELANLAESYNVASFISLTPHQPFLRYQLLPGAKMSRSMGPERAIEHLLQVSRGGSVNVRSFRQGSNKGNPFHYGLKDVSSVMRLVNELAHDGFFCIVNETIDVHDGGVSGVTLGGIAEFAPDDTPRVVESGDTARLPASMAERILQTVYGQGVQVPTDPSRRIEFSVHPYRVGHRSSQVVVWETESVKPVELEVDIRWPNRFSRLLGDKTFGLMVAEAVGASVPRTTVISRRVAPFQFGCPTNTGEWWMRTAPAKQTPGHFTTTRGWTDPFAVLAKEDSDTAIAAVLAQEGVAADYSGATLPRKEVAGHLIEGVRGVGSDFMLGNAAIVSLPSSVEKRVQSLLLRLERALGSGIRIEWASDSDTVWVLQLHRTNESGQPGVLSAGHTDTWLPFDPSLGLEALSDLIADAREQDAGIEVIKPVGLTSHVGDLLRKAKVPGRLHPSTPDVSESASQRKPR